jgi:hypothetical protein
MSWRKWLVRGLVFGIVGAAACAAVLYQRWTNPVAIRQQVLDKLRELFPGAEVALDSARLQILGGIQFNELRVVRRDDPDRAEVLYVPGGVLYHDKEKLLDGRLAFRKVELDRPRLHVVRGRDGRCNLDGLAARARPDAPLPTVVVHQGTLFLEDQLGPSGLLPVEIHNADLTLVNDPLPVVLVTATGRSEVMGALEVHGTWQRESHALELEARAKGVPLSPGLVRRAAPYCPDSPLHTLLIAGQADLEADVAYQPQSAQPLHYEVRCRLKQVSLQHPKLCPVPLDKVEASLRCANGKVTLKHLTGRAGEAEVEAHGSANLPCVCVDLEGELTVKHLALCQELFERLPKEHFEKLHRMFNPRGPVTLTFRCACRGDRWERKHCVLHPENVSVCFDRFPYPVERLTGSLDVDLLKDLYQVDLQAFSGSRPVMIKGTWHEFGTKADVKLDIFAKGIPIDEKLLTALKEAPKLQDLARSFHATGRGDGRALIRHTPGTPADKYCNEYHVQFQDAAVKWDQFPYPLENVSGVLDIYPSYWEFHDFQGTRHGGTVAVRGRSDGPGGEGRLVIDLDGRSVSLDADLRAALRTMPGLAKAWDTFAPAGRMDFTARIDHSLGKPQELDVELGVRGCSIEPHFFRYSLTDLAGKFHYSRNRLSVSDVRARHQSSYLSLGRGTVDLVPADAPAGAGGFYADLADFQGYPLFPDDDLLKALPPALKSFLASLQLKAPGVVKTRLVVAHDGEPGSPPDVFWDGQLWLRDARLHVGVPLEHVTGTVACVGRHDGRQLLGLSGNVLLDQASCFQQPFQRVHSKFWIDKQAPDVLHLGLKAPLFGGDISGQARVELNSLLRYELDLTASQIRLEDFGAYNIGPEPKLSGLAQGRLYLTGQGAGVDTLDGNGRLDVPDGKLIHLPLLLDLLKFLGLRWPDRTAFQEAHAVFAIHGKRLQISQLDLLGNPVSLSGNGAVDLLDGSDLQMNFFPTWGRTEQLLPPVVRTVPSAISKNLLKIEVRGKVGMKPGDLQFTKKPVPILTDPLYQMRDRVAGKTN